MKRIYILLLALPLLLSSCLFDDKDAFDESAPERMNATIKKTKEALEGAKNGWLMKLYPHKEQIYGGYTLFVKFSEGNKVTVASEKGDAGQTIESMYDVIGDSGPVLTFNSYNAFIHYFSEPMNTDYIGPDDSGMGGDYEFMVLEATPEKVALLGKKTRNAIYMTPLPDGEWKDMVGKYIDANETYNGFVSYVYTINGITANVTQSYRYLTFTYPGDNNAVNTFTTGFRHTPTGYEFYEPITIGGAKVSEMAYKLEGNVEAFADAGNSGAKLTVVYQPINKQLVGGDWYFMASTMSPYTLTQWKLSETVLTGIGQKMRRGWLGRYLNAYGLCFYMNDGSNDYGGRMVYNYQLIGDNQIKFICTMRGNNNGIKYHNNGVLPRIMNTIVYGLNKTKTFTLTGNNSRNSTMITLKDDSIPTNYFTVSKAIVDWPFDK